MAKGTHSILYGSTEIDFRLSYSDRKTLGISVHPDLSVEVNAPNKAPIEKIFEKVTHRARWIQRQKEHFQKFLPTSPEREYVSGETFLYLGKQYRLKVVKSSQESVTLKGRYIEVGTPDKNKERYIQLQVEEWYRLQAIELLRWRMEQCLLLFTKHSLSFPILRIRKMSRRWGSCSSSGSITLNIELVKAPVKCIDYVIIHELCHVVHHNHGKEFYALLTKTMPGWEKWKHKLERIF